MKPRLVVKVGTSTLLEDHELPTSTFELVGRSIKQIHDTYDVVLVTSGAIGFGIRETEMEQRPTQLPRLQALASIGQIGLMERWRQSVHYAVLGQVLVTAHELEDVSSASLLQKTFEAMWAMNVIPVVNENDAITNEEITFGDNDKLAALIAVSIRARELILLTDQDGMYAQFGTPVQTHVREIAVTDAETYVGRQTTRHGTGGMASKLIAASIAQKGGVQPYIASARQQDVIRRVIAGECGTKLI